ncbi:MAG: Histidine kinaselike ATPase protein [Actinoallomurus sp.]|nr:Histidine kinaselike ATPase protein [Actinoallomurus sp.]
MAEAESRDDRDGEAATPEQPAGTGGTGPGEVARWVSGDGGGRLSQGMADVLVHRLFAVGLDLHAALTYIEAHIAEHVAIEKIHNAICGLDGALRDFRSIVFDLHQDGFPPSPPGSLRSLIVEAVERACQPTGGGCPVITLGSGVDAVTDEATSHQVARLIHQVLALVPPERLPSAHIEVAADPRPPGRLVVHIDVHVRDLADAVGRLGTMDGQHIDISCQALTRSPACSRIRLECRTAPP